jgi:hypothetical protein
MPWTGDHRVTIVLVRRDRADSPENLMNHTPPPPVRPLPAALLLLAIAACAPACQPAQGSPTTLIASPAPPPPRTVSVTGTAELKTAPDEFVVSVGVDSSAEQPQAAKDANDRTMTALLAVPKSLQIDPKHVRTEGFTLRPRYEGSYENRRLAGYEAGKTLVIVVHDSEKVEALLAELFNRGANRLDGVTYGSTRVLEQRKEARTMAVAAAQEKAQAMAASLGQKLGRPLKIDEDPEAAQLRSMNQLTNAAFNNDTRPALGEAMATGKIRIAASVAVTFELVD